MVGVERVELLAHDLRPAAEAAKRLGVHPNTLAGWVSRGWLKGVEMPGGEMRFREDDVDALRERIYGE